MAEHDKRSTSTGMMPVTGLVPIIPVLNLERSVEFYDCLVLWLAIVCLVKDPCIGHGCSRRMLRIGAVVRT